MDVSRLTTWLQKATAPLIAMGVLVGAIASGIKFGEPLLAGIGVPSEWAIVLATLLPAGAAALLLRASSRIITTRSRLLRPERFDLRVRSSHDLLGRAEDIKDLHDLLQEYDLVFVDGESGSGKSSLVAHGLVPAIRQSPDLCSAFLSEYFGDWQNGLAHRVYQAITESLSAEERKQLDVPDVRPSATDECTVIAMLLERMHARLGRKCVLILDQFDDYQLAHRQRFLDRRNAWITPKKLKSRNRFWQILSAALNAGHVKVVLVTRSDSSAGLHSMRITEAVGSRSVIRLDQRWLPALFARVLDDDGKGPVIADPDHGWSELLEQLQRDLASSGELLPQQLRIAILGLSRLRFLTPSGYRRAGGVKGLEALYVHEAIRSAARRSGATDSEVRKLLLCFVEKGSSGAWKTVRKPEAALARILPNDKTRKIALEQLRRDEILRETDAGQSVPEFHWQLDHDYLAAAVILEERANDGLAVTLREGAAAYDAAGKDWGQKYRSLLTVRTQLVLARARLSRARQFRYGAYGKYARLSLLRFAPLLLLLFVTGWWGYWSNTASYQISRMVELGAQVRTSLGEDGAPAWAGALTLAGFSNDAFSVAQQSRFSSIRAAILGKIGKRLAELGESQRAATTLREAFAALPLAPENSRMNALGEVIAGLRELARMGKTEEALSILQDLAPISLLQVPQGNNRVAVALGMAELFRELNQSKEAHRLILAQMDQIMSDRHTLAWAARELHQVGDDEAATKLLIHFAKQIASSSGDGQSQADSSLHDIAKILYAVGVPQNIGQRAGQRDSQVSDTAELADALREVGKQAEAATFLQSAFDQAANMQPIEVRNATEGRTYVQYFGFSGAAEFAGILVRAGRGSDVPFIANREGDVQIRVDVYCSAADEAYRSGYSADVQRFMSLAAEHARAITDPALRARALVTLGEGYEGLGDASMAHSIFEEALQDAHLIPESYDSVLRVDRAEEKLNQLIRISRNLVVSRPSDARRVAREAESLSRRTAEDPTYYLPRLAGVLAQTGELRLARIVAERARNGDDQLQALAQALTGAMIHKNSRARDSVNDSLQ